MPVARRLRQPTPPHITHRAIIDRRWHKGWSSRLIGVINSRVLQWQWCHEWVRGGEEDTEWQRSKRREREEEE